MNPADRLAELFRTSTPETAAASAREAERLVARLDPGDPARQYLEGLRMLASLARRRGRPE